MATMVNIGSFITQTPGVCGGRPRIAGTRITVQNVVMWHEEGWTPEKIVEQYEHLSLAQVHAALAYYHANKEELDKQFAEYRAEAERLEREHLSREKR